MVTGSWRPSERLSAVTPNSTYPARKERRKEGEKEGARNEKERKVGNGRYKKRHKSSFAALCLSQSTYLTR